jgi:glycosyltransferase involved in cell wall biosynthesis
MRIAQVAPLYESVPPKLYGGTERVVSYLTEQLVREGHEVTLFASGDSRTDAKLISPCKNALRLDADCRDSLAYHVLMLEQINRMRAEFDIIHFHIDYLHYAWARRERIPHVTTLHGRLDLPELSCLYREFRDVPVVSISDSQRAPLPWLNWKGTVYHGLPLNLYTFQPEGGRYLAFVGRISPEKGLDDAIEIAKRAGLGLKVAAKVDNNDREYYEEHLKARMQEPHVEFLGEVDETGKNTLMGGALAVLAPICWPEPFGLVVIESLACGTPVIAYGRGSVPELIDDGVTGFIVRDVAEATAAVERVQSLRRSDCRRVLEQRFSAERMTRDYLSVYRDIFGAHLEHAASKRRKTTWMKSLG